MTTRQKLVALLVVLLASFGALATTSSPAHASGGPIVYNQHGGSIPMYWGTRTTAGVQKWLPQSSRFNMYCWVDDQWYNGNYNTNRWFYGQTFVDGSWGYVPASFVYYQTSVPHC